MKGGQFGYHVSTQACRERIDATLQRLGVDSLDMWVLRGTKGDAQLEEAMAGMKVRKCAVHSLVAKILSCLWSCWLQASGKQRALKVLMCPCSMLPALEGCLANFRNSEHAHCPIGSHGECCDSCPEAEAQALTLSNALHTDDG